MVNLAHLVQRTGPKTRGPTGGITKDRPGAKRKQGREMADRLESAYQQI